MPTGNRLYNDLAYLWPHLSPPEHYAEECETLRELLVQSLGEPPNDRRWSVLELGAGGGHATVHLKQHFDVTAADLSPAMLEQCNTLNPDVPTVVGDMRSMRLDQTFDAVLICDAVDYMLSADDVAKTLATAADHLRPGGVLLVAPTYTRETFTDGDVADDGTTIPGIAGDDDLTYFSFVHDPDPADSTFEMILLYLIRDAQTRAVQVIEDRHDCGLFAIADWETMLAQAGFTAQALAEQQDPEGNGSAWSVVFRGVLPGA